MSSFLETLFQTTRGARDLEIWKVDERGAHQDHHLGAWEQPVDCAGDRALGGATLLPLVDISLCQPERDIRSEDRVDACFVAVEDRGVSWNAQLLLDRHFDSTFLPYLRV